MLPPVPAFAPMRAILTGSGAPAGLIAYAAIRPEQVWILGLTTVLTALAIDGTVRSNPVWTDERPLASLAFLFLPAATALGGGLFIDHAINGYARPLSALATGVLVGLGAFGEYHTVDVHSKLYGP